MYSRDELVAMAQAGEAYAFIPLGVQALRQWPDDAGLRFLLATNYARLLLKTAASEQLDQLPPEARNDTSTLALRQVLTQLPDDRVPVDVLMTNLRKNVAALNARTDEFRVDLEGRVEGWRAWVEEHEFFVARSMGRVQRQPGSAPGRSGLGYANALVRRRYEGNEAAASGGGGRSGSEWLWWFGDARAACEAVPVGPERKGDAVPPMTIEGVCPPWLFQKVYASSRDPGAGGDGHRVPIHVLQADVSDFMSGLALADISTELSDPRVRVFLGDEGAARWRQHLDTRMDLQVLGPAYTNVGLCRRVEPPAHVVLSDLQQRQRQSQADLLAKVQEVYEPRTPEWYAHRYEEAGRGGGGTGERLRLLVPTCRYSTFIQHSARDIAEAFSAAGWDAKVLIEPDEYSRLASPTYLRAFAEFKPDLVVLINYTRANLGDVTPANVPFVCWVQDAMPHLFDAKIGAAQTVFDFVAGHIHEELHSKYGFERRRTVSLPVMVSTRKFHAGAVGSSQRKQHECEIAFVSHHSSPPRELHSQIIASGQTGADVRAIFERLFPVLRGHVNECAAEILQPRIRKSVQEVAGEVLGETPATGLVTRLVNNYAFPIADRMIRHDVVDWAASVCRRRSWRLRLHGRGWERQSAYAEFAAGELAHGEELRASYQAAACHVHASIHWLYHQRVMECACAGGLPIYRLKADDLKFLDAYSRCAAAESGAPRRRWSVDPAFESVDAADHPELLARLSLLQRLGHPGGQVPDLALAGSRESMAQAWQGLPMHHDVAWLLGDPAEVSFRSEEELEAVIEKAVTMPRWREQLSSGIAGRVQRHFTYDRAVEQIVGLVVESLNDTASKR